MKLKKQLTAVLTGMLALTLTFAYRGEAAEKKKFSCALDHGIYTTIVSLPHQGNFPMIRWKSDTTGLPVKAKCFEISKRIQGFSDNGVWEQMKVSSGSLSNHTVLCFMSKVDDSCNNQNLLFTLKLGDDPDKVINQLFEVKTIVKGKPIELGNNQLITYKNGKSYLHVNLLEEALPIVKSPIPDQELTPVN